MIRFIGDAFNPFNVGNWAMWIEADKLYSLDGSDGVVLLGDCTPSGRNVGQSDPTKRMLWVANGLNGHPVIRGNAFAKFLTNGSISGLDGLTKRTIVTVRKRSASGSSYTFYQGQNSWANHAWVMPTQTLWSSTTTGWHYYSEASVDQTAKIIIEVYDGTQTGNTNRFKQFVNGAQQSLTYGTVPASLGTTTGITLGSNYAGSADHINGDIAVFGISLTALTTAEMAYLNWGLGLKYGIAV